MTSSRSSKSGLTFSVAKIARVAGTRRYRLTKEAAICLTAVLEYVSREVLDLAGYFTVLDSYNLHMTMSADDEMLDLLESVTTQPVPVSAVPRRGWTSPPVDSGTSSSETYSDDADDAPR